MTEKKKLTPIERIQNKSAAILVVDSNVNLRTMITNSLKQLGYENIHVSNDFTTGIGILESEDISWVISNLQTENKLNIYHILGLCTKQEELKKILITCFITDQDKKHVPHLAAQGAMAWFYIKTTEEYITDILKKFPETIREHRNDPVLVAAGFYRDFLVDSGKYKEAVFLYQNLLTIYPGDPDILLEVAECQLLGGEQKDGGMTLAQIINVSPDHRDEAQKIADKYLGGKLPTNAVGGNNPFGIKECCLIGIDAHSHSIIEELLKETNVNYQKFDAPEDALISLRDSEEPTMLIHGWWADGINTPAFLQEFRDLCPHTILVTIYGALDGADMALLDELCSAAVIKPPLDREKAMEKLVWSIQQDRRPLEKKFLITSIYKALADGEIDLAIKYKEDLEQNPLANQGDINLVTAEILFKQGKPAVAVDCAINALRYNADAVASLNAMGKCFMALGALDKAFQAFDQAQELSPLSIKRLCVMAEAQFEMGNVEESEALLQEAGDIHEDSQDIASTKAKTEIANGNISIGKELLSKLGSIKSIIGYLNNKAVSLALEKKYDEAVAMYQQAFESIPDEHARYRNVVQFNLALLHLRRGEMDKAEEILQVCTLGEDRKIAEKAQGIVDSIANARSKKQTVKMKEKEAPPKFVLSNDNEKKIKRSMRLVKNETIITKGERCLYLIITAQGKLKVVNESLATLPGYKAKKEMSMDDKKVWV